MVGGDLSLDTIAQQLLRYPSAEVLRHISRLEIRHSNPEQYHALRAEVFVRDLQFAQALVEIEKAVRISPNWAPLYNIQANSLTELGRFDEARRSFDRAIALAPDVPEFQFNRAQLLFLLGEWQAAWPDYEGRLRSPLFQPHPDIAAYPQWLGELVPGHRLLLYWEQGHGDTLQFIRFAHQLMQGGMTVVLEVQESMTRLISQSFPGATVVDSSFPLPLVDSRASIPSLPWLLRMSPETLPKGAYLQAEVQADFRVGVPLAAVGLVWGGNPNHINDRQRSIPQEQFLSLTATPGISFYSLQVGATDKARRELARAKVTDLAPNFTDFADTAAAIQALDLVITVDTSVAHLAGALGKPVWVLLPFVPDWRWMLNRSDSPWYPSARLFRQSKRGDWASVLKEVKQALIEFRTQRAANSAA